ncbi:hypothetical protein EDB19DRAFT_1674184 [Suillus lakei]|nr:hypothetical protein EDB19DRAFT_1674184 [Suillus lakei]
MANSEVNMRLDSGLIGALQKILAHSQVIIPDLETPYSRFPNISAVNSKDLGISAIVTERQQQLDAVLHKISGLESVMDSSSVDKKEKIIQSMNLHKGLNSITGNLHSSSDPKRDAPMQLATICRRWRDCCRGHPEFVARTTFGRARGNLERLSLAVLCYKNNETKLRSIIQPYISQISSLYVEFFPGANPELMLKDIPALRELTVRSHNDMPAMSQSALRLPSTLRSFKLVGLDLTLKRISSLSPIFAQLTNIEIAVHHPSALLRLLQLSPNLSSLTV